MRTDEAYRAHAADLIQGQLQQPLVAALGHQLQRGLLETRLALQQQARDVSDTLGGGAGERMKQVIRQVKQIKSGRGEEVGGGEQ